MENILLGKDNLLPEKIGVKYIYKVEASPLVAIRKIQTHSIAK